MSDIEGMWARSGVYVLEWAEFGQCVRAVVDAVQADGFAPTVVCAVARGGLTAAGYLATALQTTRVHTVRVRRTRSDERYATKQEPSLEVVSAVEFRPDDRVLIVDDIVGTGVTEKVVRAHLATLGPAEVRSAALVRNHRSPTVPDYCPVVIDDWIVFPWEDGWAPAVADGGRPVQVGSAAR